MTSARIRGSPGAQGGALTLSHPVARAAGPGGGRCGAGGRPRPAASRRRWAGPRGAARYLQCGSYPARAGGCSRCAAPPPPPLCAAWRRAPRASRLLISAGARLTCHAPSGGCGARPAPRGDPRPMGRDGWSRVRSGPAAGHGDSRDAARPAHPARSLRALAEVHAGSRWPPGWSSHPRPSEGRMRRRRGGGLLGRGGPGRIDALPAERKRGDAPLPAAAAGRRARLRKKKKKSSCKRLKGLKRWLSG